LIVCEKNDEGYDLLAENNQDGEQAGIDEERDATQQNETEGYGGGDQEMADTQATAAPAQQQGERQPNKVRITTRYLTKYERARVLGTRALQIRYVRYNTV
jgi:DNA-directed RNA polymerase I, II, and III subunit RPABC2